MKKINKKMQGFITIIVLLLTINSCTKNASVNPPPPLPTVTNVQPKNPKPGDVVTITGTSFGTAIGDVKITIGTQVMVITVVSDTEIKFTLPTGVTAGDIAVYIKGIVAVNTDPQKAAITPQPATSLLATITAINPTNGKVGDIVTISGTNFGTAVTDNVFKFNGIAATITAATSTTLTTTVPATATTGVVTLSVKGATTVTGPTFTVNTSTGGSGSTPPYITIVSGNATFTKIATASSAIGAMIIDKPNNTLYYSDYNYFVASHVGTLYKLKLDGSAPEQLSTDTRINTIIGIATDAAGNVYAAASLDNLNNKANIYKIDATTKDVSVIANNVIFGGGSGSRNFFVDTKGNLWLSYFKRLNISTGQFEQVGSPIYQSYSSGASYQGDDIYVEDGSICGNGCTGGNIGYVKFNLLSGKGTRTDFTLKTLFEQDYSKLTTDPHSESYNISTRYCIDGNENFYAIYPTAGDVASSGMDYFIIRKTKNGNVGASTLLTKFYTTPPSTTSQIVYQSPNATTALMLQSDAIGSLYLKCNGKEIVKITY